MRRVKNVIVMLSVVSFVSTFGCATTNPNQGKPVIVGQPASAQKVGVQINDGEKVSVGQGEEARAEVNASVMRQKGSTIKVDAPVTVKLDLEQLRGAIGPQPSSECTSVTCKWWFWTILGVGLGGAGIATALAIDSRDHVVSFH
jgi:hypothetical protein